MGEDWWQTFFDRRYTDHWAGAGAFDRTDDEIAGIQRLLPATTGLAVLDVPCGFGRHAGALHRAGHRVTGVDLSADQLSLAAEHNAGPTYVQGDMRIPPPGPFDAVLNLFSSIGYFDEQDEDLRALRAWHDALVPGGVLVIETNHRDRVARIHEPDAVIPIGDTGAVEFGRMHWATGVMHRTIRFADGTERHFRVRLYAPTELADLVRRAGFGDLQLFGDWSGAPLEAGSRLIIRATA
ncbi:class I SAM-dependent methyltransferase [soil metagenome]